MIGLAWYLVPGVGKLQITTAILIHRPLPCASPLKLDLSYKRKL